MSQIFPCDGVDFISRFPVVGSDFLWTTTVALFKEPAATAAMEGTGAFTRPATTESLTKAFDAVLAAVDGAPPRDPIRVLEPGRGREVLGRGVYASPLGLRGDSQALDAEACAEATPSCAGTP